MAIACIPYCGKWEGKEMNGIRDWLVSFIDCYEYLYTL